MCCKKVDKYVACCQSKFSKLYFEKDEFWLKSCTAFIFKHNTSQWIFINCDFYHVSYFAFLDFGILLYSKLHGGSVWFGFSLHVHLFFDETPFNSALTEHPERNPLFTGSQTSPTVSCKGHLLHLCVTIRVHK